jgi:hypothetical protein
MNMTRDGEWKFSLAATLMAFVLMGYTIIAPLPILLLSTFVLGYLARRTIYLFELSKRTKDETVRDTFDSLPHVHIDRKKDGKVFGGPLAFFTKYSVTVYMTRSFNLDDCHTVIITDPDGAQTNLTNKARLPSIDESPEVVFQYGDGTWGWYNDDWDVGDEIKYKTRIAAEDARAIDRSSFLG